MGNKGDIMTTGNGRVTDRHAYCIIAHNEPKLLKALVEMIDDERNDVFIMVDSKTDISIFDGIETKRCRLRYTPRVDVRWGDVSQVEAELTVFECAHSHGPYRIYHLISGVDLPIKSQDYIHSFVAEHPDTELVGYAQNQFDKNDLRKKTRYYHSFTKSYKCRPIALRKAISLVRRSLLALQAVFGIDRKYPMELRKGVNWCSITEAFCSYLVGRKDLIMRMFRHTCCCDEIFLQTVLWNSPYRENIYRPDKDFESCLRLIDWKRGNPYVWGSGAKIIGGGKNSDMILIKESDAFFARKFSSKHMEIVAEVRKQVDNN